MAVPNAAAALRTKNRQTVVALCAWIGCTFTYTIYRLKLTSDLHEFSDKEAAKDAGPK